MNFQKKLFMTCGIAFCAAGSLWADSPDYSLDVYADKLSYSEADKEAKLEVVVGKDINVVWYRVVNDRGQNEVPVTKAEGNEISVPLLSHGAYTVIAAGFESDDDLSNPLEYTECYFYYEPDETECWQSLGMGSMTDDFVSSIFYDLPNLTYNVEIQKNKNREGEIRLVNPFGKPFCDEMRAAGVPASSFSYNPEENHYMYIDISDPTFVYISECCTGLRLMQHDVLLVGSFGKYFIDQGRSKDEIRFANYEGSFKDNTITFHQNGLYTMFYPDYEISSANLSEAFSIVLPDETRVDYVDVDAKNCAVYNLQGVKVADSSENGLESLPRGFYIVNGKKVIAGK